VSQQFLGSIIIVIGVIAIASGVGGGIATMFKEIQQRRHYGLEMLPVEWLKALTEFLKALTKAPTWLALIVVGMALLAWGGKMLG
jgi:hypothetical protein